MYDSATMDEVCGFCNRGSAARAIATNEYALVSCATLYNAAHVSLMSRHIALQLATNNSLELFSTALNQGSLHGTAWCVSNTVCYHV